MRIVTKTRTISFRGSRETAAGSLSILMAVLLLSFTFAACGTVSPSARVAEGFFDAIRAADAERFKALLDAETRDQFEASMNDAELVDYLKHAAGSLKELYGANWRNRIQVATVKPGAIPEGAETPDVKYWDVSVGIRDEKDGGQVIRVMEKDGRCYLDLAQMDGFSAVK